jgi:hypothetical protein
VLRRLWEPSWLESIMDSLSCRKQVHSRAAMRDVPGLPSASVVSAPGAWFWPPARTLIAERGQPSGGSRARSRLIETSGRRCGPGRADPGVLVARSGLLARAFAVMAPTPLAEISAVPRDLVGRGAGRPGPRAVTKAGWPAGMRLVVAGAATSVRAGFSSSGPDALVRAALCAQAPLAVLSWPAWRPESGRAGRRGSSARSRRAER